MTRSHIKTALGLVGLSLLATCGQPPTAPRETKQEENPKAVPTHVSQALAVNAAALHRTISPQSVGGEYVVSTEVYDPEGNLAYLANVIAPGPYTFEEALTKLPETAEVYLTGTVTDRPFHSETFTVKAIKNLKAQCPSCKLVYFNQALYGVEGENWYTQEGLLPTEEVQRIKETFAVLKKSIEESDIPEKMAEAWKKLIEGSTPLTYGSTSPPFSPVLGRSIMACPKGLRSLSTGTGRPTGRTWGTAQATSSTGMEARRSSSRTTGTSPSGPTGWYATRQGGKIWI